MSLSTPPFSPVTLTQVQPVFNKKHLVSEILVTFSGAVNAPEAQETGIYRLVTPGKHGSFTAKNAGSIKLRSAVYDAASDTVTLTPKKAFSLSKPVEVTIKSAACPGPFSATLIGLHSLPMSSSVRVSPISPPVR